MLPENYWETHFKNSTWYNEPMDQFLIIFSLTMLASSFTTSSTMSLSSSTSIHSSHQITLKFNGDNYLSWKAQLLSYLHLMVALLSHLNFPITFFLLNASLPNPTYKFWYEQDQLILSIFISSLSDFFLSQIIGLNTSHGVWVTLEIFVSTMSCACQMNTLYQQRMLKREVF